MENGKWKAGDAGLANASGDGCRVATKDGSRGFQPTEHGGQSVVSRSDTGIGQVDWRIKPALRRFRRRYATDGAGCMPFRGLKPTATILCR